MSKIFTIAQAAEAINMNPRSLRRNIHEGHLPATLGKHGKMDVWQIDDDDLRAFAAERNRPTYDALMTELKQLRRESLRFLNRVQGGTVDAGDVRRFRSALLTEEEAEALYVDRPEDERRQTMAFQPALEWPVEDGTR